MSISEQLRALVTAMADVQRTASFDTQCRVAEAATILVREAIRLEAEAPRLPRLADALEHVAVKVGNGETVR